VSRRQHHFLSILVSRVPKEPVRARTLGLAFAMLTRIALFSRLPTRLRRYFTVFAEEISTRPDPVRRRAVHWPERQRDPTR
jgi:hypothetical protein